MGYSKLFSEIVMSTIWREPDHVRIVWITLLAIKDRWHKVNASLPGLADIARVTIDECLEAIKALSSPDHYSRTQENEGRRIQQIDGGWVVLNGEKYRNKMSLDERREYNRIKQREYRNNKIMSNSCVQSSTESAHTDTDTDINTPPNPLKGEEKCTQKVDTLIKSPPLSKNKKKVAEPKSDPGFDAFWKEYPNKQNKGQARISWAKLKPDQELQQKILDALRVQKKSKAWTKENGEFIPHPSTWLNAEGWDNEVKTSQNTNSWSGLSDFTSEFNDFTSKYSEDPQ